jgi:hypothetical protein
MTAEGIPCPICGAPLAASVTTNRNGKHAVSLHCPEDGRHMRAFINHRPFVQETIDRMLAEAERLGTGRPAWAAGQAGPDSTAGTGPVPEGGGSDA